MRDAVTKGNRDLLYTIFRPRLRPRGIRFPCASPFSPPRGRISKNPHLVLTYTPQRTHMPNFRSLRPVVLAVRCLSVSHLVTEEFYIILIDLFIYLFSNNLHCV